MKYITLTSPPTPPLRGEGSKITPPSLIGKGAGGLGLYFALSAVCGGCVIKFHLAQLLFVVYTHLGLKSQADSESPLKWTVIKFCLFLKKILAIAQLIRVHTYQFQSILISVRFNALELLARNLFMGGKTTQNQRFEFVVHTHLGMQGIK
ncbi:hypothetical protein NIES4075_15080 [Tolypothrix sp. NIES-4075]|nr:hypothetical protein NIES4075_15080 [Tolypothrix sp. NIES-4075]